jgi:hypothetical protein
MYTFFILTCAIWPTHITLLHNIPGACSSTVDWGPMLQAGKSRVRVLMRWIFFSLPNPSSHTMALGLTQPLTEMSTRNLSGEVNGGWRVRLTLRHLWADCLEKMWKPRRLTTLRAFMACYRDSFTFTLCNTPNCYHMNNHVNFTDELWKLTQGWHKIFFSFLCYVNWHMTKKISVCEHKHKTLTMISFTAGNISSALCSRILSIPVARECRIFHNLKTFLSHDVLWVANGFSIRRCILVSYF